MEADKPTIFEPATDPYALDIKVWGINHGKQILARAESYMIRSPEELNTRKWEFPLPPVVIKALLENGEADYTIAKSKDLEGIDAPLWVFKYTLRKPKNAHVLTWKDV